MPWLRVVVFADSHVISVSLGGETGRFTRTVQSL